MPGSKFYTGRGDDGITGLLGPGRVPKYDPRPEAYGTVDEAQAGLGLVRAGDCTPRVKEIVLVIQRTLYLMMSELAAAGDADSPFTGSINPAHLEQLETWIAEFEAQIRLPREFVVPGDSQSGATLHLARTIVRRAERTTVRLASEGLLANEQVMRYLNRLSSLLFVLALFEDNRASDREPTFAKGDE
jgi:cob(I)alamin adenosyltransferase